MRRIIPFAAALLSIVLLFACGGGSMKQPVTVANGIPVSLSINDTPPARVAVLFFEMSITAASLQPSDPMKPAIAMLNSPVEVEFGHLQTDTAFLSLAKVNPDTYSSMTLTLGNPQLTIVNHSGKVMGSCPDNTVCQLTPSVTPSTTTLSSSPFPLTIDTSSVVGIKLDLNVNSSLQNDLSINPSVSVAKVTQRHDSDEDMEIEDIDELNGRVTSAGSNQFILMDRRSGQSFTVNVDSNTVFEDFDRAGCTANPLDFTCTMMGQVVQVRLSENGMGTMLAKRVEFVENASQLAVKGIITSVDSSTQFHMVVFLEEPAANGISEGEPVVVTIAPNAAFQVAREEMGDHEGVDNSGFSFASSADLMVGQDVQVHQGTVTSATGAATLTTDLVRLWPSQITGQVGSVNSGNGTFTLTDLSTLFTGATPPVNTIDVQTLSEMDFQGSSGNQSSPSVGDTVSVKGLLFNTPTTPALVTRTIHDHRED